MASARRRRARARALRACVSSRGTDFAAFAREHSQGPEAARGGDMGWIARGSLPQEFERAAFGARPGQVAAVVETRLGFEIVKVVEKRAARQRSLEEVREAIHRTIAETRLNEKRREALAALHRNAKIGQLFSSNRSRDIPAGSKTYLRM
jgi:peptidyl-prolyl cis-trans isomerase C